MKLTLTTDSGAQVWEGTVKEINQLVDTVKETVSTPEGPHTDFRRTGTGRVTVEFLYTGGPEDALRNTDDDPEPPFSAPADADATMTGAEPEQ